LSLKAGVIPNISLDERMGEDKDPIFDRQLEIEDDKITYARFNDMKLVNIKATMMKGPDDRSEKEVEYICLWLRQNFEVFLDIEKQDVIVLMKRLSINNFLPG
jgi:ribosomal protein S18 acetylase RimI-like enzyme